MNTGFYVSAIDGPKKFLMRGPFATQQEALDLVSDTLKRADALDPRSIFMAWGTAKLTQDDPLPDGRINKYLN